MASHQRTPAPSFPSHFYAQTLSALPTPPPPLSADTLLMLFKPGLSRTEQAYVHKAWSPLLTATAVGSGTHPECGSLARPKGIG